jgi:hypothetical protein
LFKYLVFLASFIFSMLSLTSNSAQAREADLRQTLVNMGRQLNQMNLASDVIHGQVGQSADDAANLKLIKARLGNSKMPSYHSYGNYVVASLDGHQTKMHILSWTPLKMRVDGIEYDLPTLASLLKIMPPSSAHSTALNFFVPEAQAISKVGAALIGGAIGAGLGVAGIKIYQHYHPQPDPEPTVAYVPEENNQQQVPAEHVPTKDELKAAAKADAKAKIDQQKASDKYQAEVVYNNFPKQSQCRIKSNIALAEGVSLNVSHNGNIRSIKLKAKDQNSFLELQKSTPQSGDVGYACDKTGCEKAEEYDDYYDSNRKKFASNRFIDTKQIAEQKFASEEIYKLAGAVGSGVDESRVQATADELNSNKTLRLMYSRYIQLKTKSQSTMGLIKRYLDKKPMSFDEFKAVVANNGLDTSLTWSNNTESMHHLTFTCEPTCAQAVRERASIADKEILAAGNKQFAPIAKELALINAKLGYRRGKNGLNVCVSEEKNNLNPSVDEPARTRLANIECARQLLDSVADIRNRSFRTTESLESVVALVDCCESNKCRELYKSLAAEASKPVKTLPPEQVYDSVE